MQELKHTNLYMHYQVITLDSVVYNQCYATNNAIILKKEKPKNKYKIDPKNKLNDVLTTLLKNLLYLKMNTCKYEFKKANCLYATHYTFLLDYDVKIESFLITRVLKDLKIKKHDYINIAFANKHLILKNKDNEIVLLKCKEIDRKDNINCLDTFKLILN